MDFRSFILILLSYLIGVGILLGVDILLVLPEFRYLQFLGITFSAFLLYSCIYFIDHILNLDQYRFTSNLMKLIKYSYRDLPLIYLLTSIIITYFSSLYLLTELLYEFFSVILILVSLLFIFLLSIVVSVEVEQYLFHLHISKLVFGSLISFLMLVDPFEIDFILAIVFLSTLMAVDVVSCFKLASKPSSPTKPSQHVINRPLPYPSIVGGLIPQIFYFLNFIDQIFHLLSSIVSTFVVLSISLFVFPQLSWKQLINILRGIVIYVISFFIIAFGFLSYEHFLHKIGRYPYSLLLDNPGSGSYHMVIIIPASLITALEIVLIRRYRREKYLLKEQGDEIDYLYPTAIDKAGT